MSCVDAPQATRAALRATIDAAFATGAKFGEQESCFATRARLKEGVDAPFATGARLVSKEFKNLFQSSSYQTPPDESGLSGGPGDGTGGSLGVDPGFIWSAAGASIPAEKLEIPEVLHSLTGWLGELGSYVLGASLGEQRGRGLQGSFRLLHHEDGFVTVPSPFHPDGGGDLAVDAHNLSTERALKLVCTTAGEPSDYPELLPGDPDVDDEGIVTLPVTDFWPLLEQDGQSRDDIVAEAGDVVYAQEEMKRIGEERGVKIICRGWPDYAVRHMPMSDGTPRSWLEALAGPYKAWGRWHGRTLVFEPTVFDARPVALYRDRFRIERSAFRLNTAGMRNSWIANRLMDTPGDIAVPKSGRNPGRFSVEFLTAASYAYVRATGVNGAIVDGVFFDAGNNPVGVGFIYTGSGAVRWEGTYIYSTPWPPGLEPGWKVQVLGNPAGTLGANRARFPLTGAYKVEAASDALVERYGSRPEYRSMDNPLVPDPQVLADLVGAHQREVELALCAYTLDTPWYNTAIRAGVVITVDDFEQCQEGALWLVDAWQADMPEPGDWYHNLGLLKPRSA